MGEIKIFTDGACSGNPGIGGWSSIFCFSSGVKIYSGSAIHTTNNRMELTAIVETLAFIYTLYNKNKWIRNEVDQFKICSDSAYCINAINNNWVQKWRMNDWKTQSGEEVKNKDLWLLFWRSYLKCKNEIPIVFEKVAGHSGNPQNELADKVAKKEVADLKVFLIENDETISN